MSTNYEPLKDISYNKMKKLCSDIEFVKNENLNIIPLNFMKFNYS